MLAVLLILAVPAVMGNSVSGKTTVDDDRVIHVHRKGTDNESCLTGQDMRQGKHDQYCKTLEYVVNKLQNSGSRNITIIFESQVKLHSTVNFSDHENLTIRGRSKDTKLSCICDKTNNSIGISFIRISNLKVYDFTIVKCCGIMNNYTTSLFIQNCSNVIIEDSQIRNNRYSGLILVNLSGMIIIRKCKFSENGEKSASTGAGLYIEFSQYLLTTVSINQCEFANNKLPGKTVIRNTLIPLNVTEKREWKRESIGGGMAIVFLNGSNAMKITINNSCFISNRADRGGGLCIYAQEETYNIMVSISNSIFVRNIARWGGGGTHIRFGELDKNSLNHISFKDVTFERNRAFFGGGTSISALFLSYVSQPGEVLQFINCMWQGNIGQYSPAVDLSPYRFQQSRQGYSPIPLFKDIKIQSNNVNIDNHNHIIQGVFVITRFTVHFKGSIHFKITGIQRCI